MTIKEFWAASQSNVRLGIMLGAVAIVLGVSALGYWAMAADYQVLFSDLQEQDASVMVAELDKLKVPYRLEEGGTRILVPRDAVYKTRLKLAGKNLPLHGVVGFEIFNNSDFGMTEFSQKVNYQRALEGELTRTIMALDEVQSARVHLALPESSLFRQEKSKAKASVTLGLKQGRSINAEQVSGIQRLVASSVAQIEADDVTVADKHGVTLSMATDGADAAASGDRRLDVKRKFEDYLGRKATQVLERALGPGQAMVSVDATLNMDRVKVTMETVLPAKDSPGEGANPVGVLVKERQITKETPVTDGQGKATETTASTVLHSESEYQVGRRVEQLVSTPGSVIRLSVGIVVSGDLDDIRQQKIRELASSALGLDLVRGDAISIYPLSHVAVASDHEGSLSEPGPQSQLAPSADRDSTARQAPKMHGGGVLPEQWRIVVTILLVMTVAALLLAAFMWRKQLTRGKPTEQGLSEHERQQLLLQINKWLEVDDLPKQGGLA